MCKAQTLVALLLVLGRFIKSQYVARAEMVASEESNIFNCPKTAHYHLRNYAQSLRTSHAIADLHAVFQEPMKTEQKLADKLNQAICRCINVHPPNKVLTLCIDALHPTIRSVMNCCRECHSRVIYLDLVDYTQHEGDTVEARTSTFQAGCMSKPLQKFQPIALLQFPENHELTSTTSHTTSVTLS